MTTRKLSHFFTSCCFLLSGWCGASAAGFLEGVPPSVPVPALAIGTWYLFPDTSLSAVSTTVVREGSLLEILGKSAREHPDKDQNQQFFWYRVQTADGQTGWAYGDGLALRQDAARLPETLRPFQRRPVSISGGFEEATLWFAAIEGRDSEEYHAGFYGEYYVVLTNSAGRSLFVRYAGQSAQGETTLRQFAFQDLTGDQRPDILLETASREKDAQGQWLDGETRNLDIFGLQNGSLRRLFSENLTLLDADDLPAPSLFKCLDIETGSIRVEYVDYLDCEKYALPPPAAPPAPGRSEQCLEFVTCTWTWNARASKFDLLYEPTRTAPIVSALNFGVSVRKNPALAGEVLALLSPDEKLPVLRQVDKLVIENGKKRMESYLFVRAPSGQFGYVAAGKVRWRNVRHAGALEAFGKQTPLLRSQWRFEMPFVRVAGEKG